MISPGSRLNGLMNDGVPPYSIAAFRVFFGLVLLWNTTVSLLRETVFYSFGATRFQLHYPLLGWLEPLPGRGIEILWLGMVVASLGVVLGLFYRVSIAFYAVAFSYSFFLDAFNYTNADYLVVLLCSLLVFIPAHSAWSVDNLRRRREPRQVRRLWLWALRAQFIVLYVGGGVAKLNSDWLRGGPLTIILAERTDMPIVGPIFALPMAGLLLSWFGLFFDLSVVFLVMYRRTRIVGLLLALGFHSMNSQLFTIGYFPWLSLFALTLFLPPTWPLRWMPSKYGQAPSAVPRTWPMTRVRCVGLVAAACLALQILVPLRHFAIGDDFVWDDNGNTFSWHMITAYKTGQIVLRVEDEKGQVLYRGPAYDLTQFQRLGLIGRPEAIRQYAHYLAAQEQEPGTTLPAVYVYAPISVNGREQQLLIDPTVNMADQPPFVFTPSYVNELSETMPAHDVLLRRVLDEIE